jgi:hypothetical protein
MRYAYTTTALAAAWLVLAAFTPLQFPPSLKMELGQYPDTRVARARTSMAGESATLHAPAEAFDDVVDYYEQSIIDSGWTMTQDLVTNNSAHLHGEKGSRAARVDIKLKRDGTWVELFVGQKTSP